MSLSGYIHIQLWTQKLIQLPYVEAHRSKEIHLLYRSSDVAPFCTVHNSSGVERAALGATLDRRVRWSS